MSAAEDLSHYIPRSLDDPEKFLFWDRDVAAVAGLCVGVGVAAGYALPGLFVGFGLAALYSRAKSRKHPGAGVHLAYWCAGYPSPNEMPESHLREFNG